jgi:hypothetical protein
MKYELQTIPVWKAYEEDTECPLCFLHREAEQRNTKFFLGNSIMVPEMRVQLNEHGFCHRHFHMLAAGTGKLGYSLALNTHMETIVATTEKLGGAIAAARGNASRPVAAYVDYLERLADDCLMCDRIQYNMRNYTYTVAKLYATEPQFPAALRSSKGFCLSHLPAVLRMGLEVVPAKLLPEWHRDILDVQKRGIAANREALEEFSWQFDYQTDKKTPERSLDAVPRGVQRLAGFGP